MTKPGKVLTIKITLEDMKKPIPRIGSSLMKVHLMQRMKKHTIKFGTKYIPSLGKKVTLRIMIKSMLLTILDRMEVQQPI